MLSGLDSVTATGIEYYYAGKKDGSERWFVGNKGTNGQYAEYVDGQLNIKAVVNFLPNSTGLEQLDSYQKLVQIAQGNIETWFHDGVSPAQTGAPTMSNYPVNTWESADYETHVGDIYYSDSGKGYRFKKTGTTYSWEIISDSELAALSQQIQGLQYLKAATNEGTLISGGLVLTSMIQLGYTDTSDVYHVMSGINGIGSDQRGIAAWFGGPMADKEATPTPEAYASTLFRFDGTGYLAKGNITWDSNGYGQVGGSGNNYAVKWDANGVTLGNGIKLGSSDETLSSLLEVVNKLDSLFTKESYTEGGVTKYRIKANYGLYSDSFISAGGFSSGGGGGGGTDFTIQALTLGALTAYYLDAPDAPQNNYLGNQAYPVGYAIRAQQDANGHTLAYLDSSGKLPLSMLPDSMLGQLIYAGTVNASGVATLTNAAKEKFGISADTVQLTNDTGTYGYGKFEGAFFLMSADSSFAGLPLQVGDWLISIGSAWKKIDNTDAVTSVVGQTGAVTAAQISSALSLGAAATKGVDTSWPTTPTNNNLPTTAAVDAKIKAYAATLPHSYTISGSSVTTYTTAYDFTSQNLVATLYDSSNNVVMTDMQIVSSSGKYGMKVIFANAIGSSTYRLVVFGV